MPKRSHDDARILRELLETAQDLNGYGVVSKIEMARINAICESPPEYPPERVVTVRTRIAKMSQSVFASFMNVSVSTVQKWESPAAANHPSGAAAKLLHLIESKGVDALIA